MDNTWDEYWESIYSDYRIKDLLEEMKESLFHWEDFESSHDGHTIDFYLESSKEARFKALGVY